ncbi:MAG: DUF547 domain-containing protein [Alphaproteobacteria bacterium]|nr:MAG: DUF547 domain-containing protein [Alphaproteobacteria bacterium]
MVFNRIIHVVALFWLALLTSALAAAVAAPKAKLWPRWETHATTRTITVDHDPWDAFLARYVVTRNNMNLVDYHAVDEADRAALDRYIASLEATPVDRLTREQQLAFWINLYNAATLRLVLEHYPVHSIRDIDISPGLFSDGPWGAKILTVAGEKLSLDDIEHRILRPIWRDPRIHYAVNCASVGCPDLARRAYQAETVDAMLDAAARAYVNHPRGIRIDNGRLIASKIYKWYAADFGGTEARVIAHARQYADVALAVRLTDMTRIHDYIYDWSLNDARP